MQTTNLFVYPTEAETFGLVLVEARLGGGAFPVLNRSLSIMREVGGNCGLYVNFGSCERQFSLINEREHYERIGGRLLRSPGRRRFPGRTWMVRHTIWMPSTNVTTNRCCSKVASERAWLVMDANEPRRHEERRYSETTKAITHRALVSFYEFNRGETR